VADRIPLTTIRVLRDRRNVLRFLRRNLISRLGGLVLLSVIVSHADQPAVIRAITISGNHALTVNQLMTVITERRGSTFSKLRINTDVASLLQRYHEEGYYFATVSLVPPVFSSDSAFVDVGFTIDEGEQTRIGTIELEGNTAFTRDEILQQFETHPGGFLDPRVLERDIDALLTRYERDGYPFTDIAIEEISRYQEESVSKLRLVLHFEEGEKVTIDEIHVAGNKETNEHVIVRESGIRPGDYYDQEEIEKIPQRLNRMNIFSRVEEPEFFVKKSGSGGLLLSVQEGNTSTFDGIIGYVPAPTADAQGYVMGLVNVTMRNLFGTARRLNVHWQRDDQLSQELSAQYVEPWVADLPVDASALFQQRQQDTTYVRRAFELKADLHVSDAFTVGGIFDQENVIPSSTLSGVVLSNSRTVTTGLELRYDSRDDIFSPTNGVNYRSDYQFGNKTILGQPIDSASKTSFTVQKVSFDAEFFVQPFLRQVVAFGVHGRQLTSDNIDVGDLYRFGGATTMRGYRENQFLGSRVGWTNAEYRFLLARRSYFLVFFDTGYYFLPGDDAKGISSIENLKYGYGIGIRLESSLGNIGVSFALGEGDSFSQGKIHIGLINDF